MHLAGQGSAGKGGRGQGEWGKPYPPLRELRYTWTAVSTDYILGSTLKKLDDFGNIWICYEFGTILEAVWRVNLETIPHTSGHL